MQCGALINGRIRCVCPSETAALSVGISKNGT